MKHSIRRWITTVIKRCPQWVASIVVVGIILWLTLAPHPLPENDVRLFPGADKVVHALMFGGLAWITGVDMAVHGKFTRVSTLSLMAICAIAAIVFGGVIEIIQDSMQAGRSGDWLDWLADSVGAIIAIPFGMITVSDSRQRGGQ